MRKIKFPSQLILCPLLKEISLTTNFVSFIKGTKKIILTNSNTNTMSLTLKNNPNDNRQTHHP